MRYSSWERGVPYVLPRLTFQWIYIWAFAEIHFHSVLPVGKVASSSITCLVSLWRIEWKCRTKFLSLSTSSDPQRSFLLDQFPVWNALLSYPSSDWLLNCICNVHVFYSVSNVINKEHRVRSGHSVWKSQKKYIFYIHVFWCSNGGAVAAVLTLIGGQTAKIRRPTMCSYHFLLIIIIIIIFFFWLGCRWQPLEPYGKKLLNLAD